MARSVAEAIHDISAVRGMIPGKAQAAAALSQLQRIENEGPQEVKAYALDALIEAYWFGGDEEKAYVPFSQAIAWYDEHPEWFDNADRFNLFWSFKWMINGLRGFPRVPLRQLWATLEDMERRYAVEGYSMDAPSQQRWRLATHLGSDDVDKLFDEWVSQPRDDMSDCDLCSAGDKVEFAFSQGRYDDCLQLMDATLANPSTRPECFSEPATMYSVAQFAYLYRGRPGDDALAARAHRLCRSYWDESSAFSAASRNIQLLQDRAFSLSQVRGQCVEFLARTRNPDQAVRLLVNNQRFLTEADSPLARLYFLLGVGAALHVMVDELGLGAQPISLTALPATDLAQLWQWARDEAVELAKTFDARNGTSHQTDLVEKSWQATAFPTQLDLRLVTSQTPEPVAEQPDVPAPPSATSPGPHHAAQPTDLVKTAERSTARGETDTAITAYLDAAALYEKEGQLAKAGFARAEAGHLALLGDDLDGAQECLTRADALLRASKMAPEFAAPVAVALAQCLAKQGSIDEAGSVLDRTARLIDENLDQPPATDVAPDVAKAHEDDLAWASVSISFERAQLMGQSGDLPGGAALAERSAERMADLGLVQQAADAFQWAGVAWTDHDNDRAIWCLQSAVEGFRRASPRQHKSQATNLLVELLQKLGRADEATAIAEGD